MSCPRQSGRVSLRLVPLTAWMTLCSFTLPAMAEDRGVSEGSRECWVWKAKIEPPPSARTYVRTLSAPVLLLELAKDALGVSELDESLFGEKVSGSWPSTGVSGLVRLLLQQIAGGSTVPSEPPLADPRPMPEPSPLPPSERSGTS